jgi:hypothetical protein
MCLEMLRHLAAALGQLHIRRCFDGSAEMNIWLHRQVMVGPRARKIDVGSGGDMSEGGYEARAVSNCFQKAGLRLRARVFRLYGHILAASKRASVDTSSPTKERAGRPIRRAARLAAAGERR